MYHICTCSKIYHDEDYHVYKAIQSCALHVLNISCIIFNFTLYYMPIVYVTCVLYILALVEPS